MLIYLICHSSEIIKSTLYKPPCNVYLIVWEIITQGRRKIDNWGGGQYSYIRVLHN